MVHNGMKVVVHHTFVEVKAQESCCDRRRVCSDSLVCYDDASTNPDSDASYLQLDLDDLRASSRRGSELPSSITPTAAWGCEELDFDDLSSCPEGLELPSPVAPSCSPSPLTPPGVFHDAPLLGRCSPVAGTRGVQSYKPHPGTSRRGEQRTTIMLRNLPSSFHQDQLLKLLQCAGFAERFDFVYLPVDFTSGACLGYGFVNLTSSSDAQLAMARLQGWSSWQDSSCHKVMQLCWSDPHQGLEMLIDRYRNSRIMHKTVPSAYKPLIFNGGKQAPFPGPTKRLRSPL